MKLKIIAILLTLSLLIVSCGGDMIIDGKKVETYGLLSVDPTVSSVKQPGIRYEIIWGNVILGCLLFETIIVPVYVFGFSLFEPVGKLPVEDQKK
jgi:hypothetical protein